MTELLKMEETVSRLLRAESILLLCHKNPDGDTVGSAAALCHALLALGKQAAVLCADGIPGSYDYMEVPVFQGQFEPTFIAAIDVASIQLFGDSISQYTQQVDLCIDHHGSNSGYAYGTLLDDTAAATAEIMFELIPMLGTEITPLMADCLYTGLSTDTGCFRFSNTTVRSHLVAAKLIEMGARLEDLNAALFENKSKGRMAAERVALDSLEYYHNGRCALVALTREQIAESGVAPSDLEGMTSLPRMIEGVDVGVTIRQQPGGSYKISVRTTKGVDACAIARRLGGGGHNRAAGCELEGTLENTKAAIIAEVEKELAKAEEETAE